MKVMVLDCTLRDGAYIVNGDFGKDSITGIITNLQAANIDIIECGWLKNDEHKEGSTYYHLPSDLNNYVLEKKKNQLFTAMIDWNRYDLSQLPECDGKSIDGIRVVFPYEHYKEGIELGKIIKEKGYQLMFQLANTMAYSDLDLKAVSVLLNEAKPLAVSIVDTFGVMYEEDLTHKVELLNKYLDDDIILGFHSHNNLQLSFALSMTFASLLKNTNRTIALDASLLGMGRGAGNTTTELLVSFLNQKYNTNYDMDVVMDTIDAYMERYVKNFKWGYSVPYFIAGTYGSHVNNIAYLTKTHQMPSKDMRLVIEAIPREERIKYDYDLLEKTYIEYMANEIDDTRDVYKLQELLQNKKVLLLAPGMTLKSQHDTITNYIMKEKPVVIGINHIPEDYICNYLFFSNPVKVKYARKKNPELIVKMPIIVSSNIKEERANYIINYNTVIKRGWKHFDNSAIMCLRLMNKLFVRDVALAGLDGYKGIQSNYVDINYDNTYIDENFNEMNAEIKAMLYEFFDATSSKFRTHFITDTLYM